MVRKRMGILFFSKSHTLTWIVENWLNSILLDKDSQNSWPIINNHNKINYGDDDDDHICITEVSEIIVQKDFVSQKK